MVTRATRAILGSIHKTGVCDSNSVIAFAEKAARDNTLLFCHRSVATPRRRKKQRLVVPRI